MPFNFIRDPIYPSVVIVDTISFGDDRGWFRELFRSSEFQKNDLPFSFDQVNQSFSKKKGTIRGLHLQIPPFEQGKFVYCTKGAIFDVAVDITNKMGPGESWIGYELSEENKRGIWIPKGFAHGFQTLMEETEVVYMTVGEYSPEAERSINWRDKEIGVEWPLDNPTLSDKDKNAPNLEDASL